MKPHQFDPHHSSGILWRIGVLAVLLAIAAVALRKQIDALYFDGALTGAGLIINGAILLMFAIGLIVIVVELVRLCREEAEVERFLSNAQREGGDALSRIEKRALIAQRYNACESAYRRNLPVNHGALAQILVARESSRLTVPRYINNILILTGVFGTIVSLSIALVGASDMLGPNTDMSGMNMVIHGMSTALSTTITAIICFVVFGYAFSRTADAQSRLIAAIEEITIEALLPRFQISQESLNGELHGLILSLRDLVDHLNKSQQSAQAVEQQIAAGLSTHDQRMNGLVSSLRGVENLLQRGFRLDIDLTADELN